MTAPGPVCVHVSESKADWPRNVLPTLLSPVMVPRKCIEILPGPPDVVATIIDCSTLVKLRVRRPAVTVNASGPRMVLRVPVIKVAGPPVTIPAVAQAPASPVQEDTWSAVGIVFCVVAAVMSPVGSVVLPMRFTPNVIVTADALLITPAVTNAANRANRAFIGYPLSPLRLAADDECSRPARQTSQQVLMYRLYRPE